LKLSIIIPVYNESATIRAIYERVRGVGVEKEIIIVDDGSEDATREKVKELCARDPALIVLRHEKNRGKGAAIRTGLTRATGEIVIVQDADLEYFPEEYPLLMKPIVEGRADAVLGSRFLGARRVFLFWHHLGNKLLTLVCNLLYNTNLTDLMTCYKMIRTQYLKSFDLRSRGFSIEAEITAKIFKSHLRVYEVPISYEGRGYEEGKKTTWLDGLRALWALLKYRVWISSVGEETLTRISKMKRFNWWLYNRMQPHLGQRVLEAGCGTGTLSYYFRDRELLYAVDIEEKFIERLRHDFGAYKNLVFAHQDIVSLPAAEMRAYRFDTAVCVNVLEHIEQDEQVLRNFYELLEPGARLIILVPAFPFLYGTLDENLRHCRRYSRRSLTAKLDQAGFRVRSISYLNFFGVFGWFLSGKVLRRRVLSHPQLVLYESLTPIFKALEERLGPPFGLSLFAVAEKV
jgi:glycosyltransferase involved in cell wall biosynthesis